MRKKSFVTQIFDLVESEKFKKIAFAVGGVVVTACLALVIFWTSRPDDDIDDIPIIKEQKMNDFEIVTNFGTMKITLYGGTPMHADNFRKLVGEHFYDGTRFHRVIPGFMIQAGDPLSKDSTRIAEWGTGGPGYTVPAEISGQYRHKKGAIAAARRGDMANPAKASSGSQFYIVQSESGCRHLDGEYTVFGEVIDGIEVIDSIAAVPTDGRDRPLEDVKIIEIRPAVDTASTVGNEAK